MDSRQTAVSHSWGWQPGESQQLLLKPHWSIGEGAAQGELYSLFGEPVVSCGMPYVPDTEHQAEPPSAECSMVSAPSISRAPSFVTPKDIVRRQRKLSCTSTISVTSPRSHVPPAEWAARRYEITDLYRYRGWTLSRVMEEMTHRGFYASYAFQPPHAHNYRLTSTKQETVQEQDHSLGAGQKQQAFRSRSHAA